MHPVARAAALAAALAFAASCSDKTPLQPAPAPPASSLAPTTAKADAERTPFQQSVSQKMAQRQAKGLPVPADVSFSYSSSAPLAAGGVLQQRPQPGQRVTIVARTVIHFDDPSQAGNLQWPNLVVEGEVPANGHGYIHGGDYTEAMRAHLARAIPDIWTRYEFGHEPRTYTFVETYTISYPANAPAAKPSGTSTTLAEILMGWTIPGPNLDYSIDWSYDVAGVTVIEFDAGFRLDWGLGVRFPVEGSLTSEDPLLEGSSYSPASTVRGLDWSAADFTAAGVAPENGNEFAMRFEFMCGIFLTVAGFDVIDEGVNIPDMNKSASFPTPIGPGSLTTLPTFDITLWDLDVGVAYGAIGFSLTPEVGSEKFTANWTATGQAPGKASGSGNLLYTAPSVNVPVGPVAALDGPGAAIVQVQDFRYYFDQFRLDLGLFFYLDVFGVWDGTFTIPIVDFDLSALTGGLYLQTHSGTPGSYSATIPILNVAPTAAIDRTAATLVHGTPVFIVHAGDPLALSGRAVDPGQDDLTLSWDWDDGPPSPDTSTLYPTPYDVTETQTHVFADACQYLIRFRAVDDDLAVGDDAVPVLVTGVASTSAQFEGYWQHQCRGNGRTDYTAAQIDCFLHIIDFMSAVFSEARPIATPAQAFDVLFLKQNGGSAAQQLDRELLVAWLNFASGAFDLMERLDTNDDGMGDRTFADVVHGAELVRLDPLATEKVLQRQAQMLHHIDAMAAKSASAAPFFGNP